MKNIAFIFSHGPHGDSSGREGLDALLATSAFCEKIGVFFIADGVLLLLPYQQPKQVLARDFIATFGLLPLYDIDKLYLCIDSAVERGIGTNIELVLKPEWLPAIIWRQRLASYDAILTF